MTISEVPAHAWETAKLSLCATQWEKKRNAFSCLSRPLAQLGSLAIALAPSLPRPTTLLIPTSNLVITDIIHYLINALPSRTLMQSMNTVFQTASRETYRAMKARCFSVARSVDSSMPIPRKAGWCRLVLSCCSLTSLKHSIRR